MKVFKFRHRLTFNLKEMTGEQRQVLQEALNACDYPLYRIRKNTRKRVPVTVRDLSTMAQAIQVREQTDEHSHGHGHDLGFHVLQDPEYREIALGLYWLPTRNFPAGRIEVHTGCFTNPPLAREVMLAEVAHAVEFGVPMTNGQKEAIFTIVHKGDASPHGTHGWWEEKGGQDYWNDWLGEVFMALFMRAFAPSLPRPLEARQPWGHKVDDSMVPAVRTVLGVRD